MKIDLGFFMEIPNEYWKKSYRHIVCPIEKIHPKSVEHFVNDLMEGIDFLLLEEKDNREYIENFFYTAIYWIDRVRKDAQTWELLYLLARYIEIYDNGTSLFDIKIKKQFEIDPLSKSTPLKKYYDAFCKSSFFEGATAIILSAIKAYINNRRDTQIEYLKPSKTVQLPEIEELQMIEDEVELETPLYESTYNEILKSTLNSLVPEDNKKAANQYLYDFFVNRGIYFGYDKIYDKDKEAVNLKTNLKKKIGRLLITDKSNKEYIKFDINDFRYLCLALNATPNDILYPQPRHYFEWDDNTVYKIQNILNEQNIKNKIVLKLATDAISGVSLFLYYNPFEMFSDEKTTVIYKIGYINTTDLMNKTYNIKLDSLEVIYQTYEIYEYEKAKKEFINCAARIRNELNRKWKSLEETHKEELKKEKKSKGKYEFYDSYWLNSELLKNPPNSIRLTRTKKAK